MRVSKTTTILSRRIFKTSIGSCKISRRRIEIWRIHSPKGTVFWYSYIIGVMKAVCIIYKTLKWQWSMYKCTHIRVSNIRYETLEWYQKEGHKCIELIKAHIDKARRVDWNEEIRFRHRGSTGFAKDTIWVGQNEHANIELMSHRYPSPCQ